MADIRLALEEANGNLPEICMCCGSEATVTKTRKMSWVPPWVGVLILAGLLPYAIIVLILTKRATVQVPLCDQHKGHWFNRNLLICGSLLIFTLIGAAAVGVSILLDPRLDKAGPFLCVGGIVLLLAWLVVLIAAQNTAIRPKEITDFDITLQGVSNEFVDAFEEYDQARRERRKKLRRRDRDDDDEDEDDEEPAPRKKGTASNAIKAKDRRPADEFEEDEPKPRKKRPPPPPDED